MENKEIANKMLEASKILNTEIFLIEVGPYLIQSLTPETVYITHKDGEGGEFKIAEVEAVLDILWWARF